MANNEDVFTKKNHLLIAGIIAFLIGLGVYILVKSEVEQVGSASTGTNYLVHPNLLPIVTAKAPIHTVTQLIEPDNTETPTPSFYPTPFRGPVGTNLPYRFEIIQWRDDYVVCDKNPNNKTVKIDGVIFSSGTPAYEYQFSFWRFRTIATPIGYTPTPLPLPIATSILSPANSGKKNNSIGEYVVFDRPVFIDKGEYYHVTISFDWEEGYAMWIDDIFYPITEKDSRCS